MNKRSWLFLMLISIFLYSSIATAEEKERKEQESDMPSHVFSIAKENTFPNKSEDLEEVEANKSTKELLETIDVPITNPKLIQLLNETSIKPSPIGIGYRGLVFLGRWPLHYESVETEVNWKYQEVNVNELNNSDGEVEQMLTYHQEERKEIHGALANKISHPDDIRALMLQAAKEKTKLPLTYHTVIGEQTTLPNTYNVGPKQRGVLHTHAPAVNEKGKATFGEVYIQLKGNKKMIVIKNMTKQGIGAWIPIENHISFSYNVK